MIEESAGIAEARSLGEVSWQQLPQPTLTRLAGYLPVLRSLREHGIAGASSGKLAGMAGVNAAVLRKDLSYIGAHGVRGVGYDVTGLIAKLSMILRSDRIRTVALAGASRLGQTLLAHTGFGHGFTVAALFDVDPALVGTRLAPGVPVIAPLEAMAERLAADPVEIGVIATADSDAQRACDIFVAAGVRQLLNVTPVHLLVGPEPAIVVRQVDLALELQVLAFHAGRSRVAPAQHEETVTA